MNGRPALPSKCCHCPERATHVFQLVLDCDGTVYLPDQHQRGMHRKPSEAREVFDRIFHFPLCVECARLLNGGLQTTWRLLATQLAPHGQGRDGSPNGL